MTDSPLNNDYGEQRLTDAYARGVEDTLHNVVIGDERTTRWLRMQIYNAMAARQVSVVNPGIVAEQLAEELTKTLQPIPDDDPRPDTKRGMYGKYYVERLHDVDHKHDACRFFVLDPLHDPYALAALRRYARACAGTHPKLSKDLFAWIAELPAIEPDSNGWRHAVRELQIAGMFKGPEGDHFDEYNDMVARHVLELLEVFIDAGHSGFSADMTVQLFSLLADFKPLSPLTDDPAYWNEVGPGQWQSARNSEAFSHDGGKTYYLLSEDRKHVRHAFFRMMRLVGLKPKSDLWGKAWNWAVDHLIYPHHKSLDAAQAAR